MDRFFDANNPIMRFLSRLVDLAFVNILAVVTALPLVTAGASLSALNYVLYHLAKEDDTYVSRMFVKSFKDNLKQGIPEGLIALLFAAVTFADLKLLRSFDSRLSTLMMIAITAVAAFVLTTFIYVFALQSRYESSVRNTIVNAFRLSVGNLPRTAGMMLIWIIWIATLVYLHKAGPLAFMIYGLSLPGYLCTMLYAPVLDGLESKKDDAEETE